MDNLRIVTRLMLIPLMMVVLLIAMAATGYVGMSHIKDALAGVYNDRVVPLRDLKMVSDLYAVNIVDTTHKVRAGTLSFQQGIASLNQADALIAKHWQAYSSTFMTEDEARLVKMVQAKMKDADMAVRDLRALLMAGDGAALARLAETDLYPRIDPLTEDISKLIELQLTVAAQSYSDSVEEYRLLGLVMLATLVLAMGLGFGVSRWIGNSVAKPVLLMADAMRRLAEGDKGTEIPAQGRKDEVGAMAGAVQVFKDNMIRAEQMAAQQEAERAAQMRRAQAMERLTGQFDQSVSSVLGIVSGAATEMEATAQSMSGNAQQTNSQATVVAAATEQASASVQTVATAAEELSASIAEIGRQVEQSSTTSRAAAEDAQRTNQTVRVLADTSARIGEVKALANQTAKATEEITSQISSVQSATRDAVGAIENIVRRIAEINQIASAIAAAVEEQSAATVEIARNVQQAAQGTQEVSSSIVLVSQAAGETGTAAEQVLSVARSLSQEANGLKGLVDSFLADVKAA